MAKVPCSEKTTAGAACRAPAGAGGLCFFHAHPDQAHTLGQVGGRKNRSKLVEPPTVGALSAAGVCNILAQAIHDVLSKKLTPRAAGALAQLCNAQHRFLQTADFETRLANLEEQLAEQAGGTSVNTDPARPRGQKETSDGTDAQPGDRYTKESGDGEECRSDGSDENGKA